MFKLSAGFAACVLALAGCSSDAQPGNGGAGAPSTGGSRANSGSSGSAGSAIGGGGVGGSAGASAGAAGSAGNAGSAGAVTTLKCTIPAEGSAPAEKLLDTGCVDPSDPRKPAPGAVTYDLNSPLWSDSADKERAFILPVGGKIHVRNCASTPADCAQGPADDGRWDFPIGTVMIKIFKFDDKLVETRLFMHTSSMSNSPKGDWIGYGYKWNEAQTEATLVPSDREQVMFNTGTRVVSWHYPSRSDCIDCHTLQSGSTLGPETAQMNRMLNGVDQIKKFTDMGLFESAPATKTAYVSPTGDAGTTEQKARSYLHANCAFCHRPDGLYKNFDLRYDVTLKDSKTCNVAGIKGSYDMNGVLTTDNTAQKLLIPGNAKDSLLWERMNQADPDNGRMPQIGSYAIDAKAQALVLQWINSLASCPQ